MLQKEIVFFLMLLDQLLSKKTSDSSNTLLLFQFVGQVIPGPQRGINWQL
jgi:hypothetical protein